MLWCDALVVIEDGELDWSWGNGRHGCVCVWSNLSVGFEWGGVVVISDTIEV